MRTALGAIACGLAVALGILGPQWDDTAGGTVGISPAREAAQAPILGTEPPKHFTAGPASHSDANTEEKAVYLNQNVIDGRPTVLCTEDALVFPPLRRAVAIWNDALSGALAFTRNTGPFEIHAPNDMVPASCDDKAPMLNVGVVVVRHADSVALSMTAESQSKVSHRGSSLRPTT